MRRVPGSPEWKRHIEDLLRQEAQNPESWWYLSFAAEKFLGGVFLKACGGASAHHKATVLGINPGGAVKAYQVDGPGPYPINTLLSKEQLGEVERF
jgi:hypothetical protein